MVISPYTRDNYVSGNLTNTASVVKFIEDNWLHGERIPGSSTPPPARSTRRGGLLDFNTRPHYSPVILNPTTGAVVKRLGLAELPAVTRETPRAGDIRVSARCPRHVRI